MRATREPGGKDLPQAIPVDELRIMLGTGEAFCSWDAADPTVSQSMDRWPFLFSPPLVGTGKKPTK
jgi:hypothetical protein